MLTVPTRLCRDCARAYHREVTEGEITRVHLRRCVWVKSEGTCTASEEAVEVTSCVTTANVETKRGWFWSAWGRAIACGAVVLLPGAGTFYAFRRRRGQKKGAQAAATSTADMAEKHDTFAVEVSAEL